MSYELVSTCQHIIMNSALLGLSSCLLMVFFVVKRLPITFLTSWDTCFVVKEEIKELRAKRQSPCASSWCPVTLNPVTGFSTLIFYDVLKHEKKKSQIGRDTKEIFLHFIHHFHSSGLPCLASGAVN